MKVTGKPSTPWVGARAAFRRFVVAGLVLGMVAVLTPTALASEGSGEDIPEVRSAERQIPIPGVSEASRHFWTWSRGRRGYFLQGGSRSKGFSKIAAVDLDSGNVVGEETLEFAAYGHPTVASGVISKPGMDGVVVVDEDQGRLFVATQVPKLAFGGAGKANEFVADVAAQVSDAGQGRFCLQNGAADSCLTGVSVVDADTLEHIRHLPLTQLRIEGAPFAPQLLAMQYAPPVDGMAAKLHLLVHDYTAAPPLIDTNASFLNPKNYQMFTYLVQLDPETGQQDWVQRLDDCRGARHGTSATEVKRVAAMGQEAALFRGADASGPAVYVACSSQSATLGGVVVRVPLSPTGEAPALVPTSTEPARLELDAPSGAHDIAVDDPPWSQPRQLAVYGPERVYRFAADPPSGRLLLQVMDGKPLAEVWWVFDTSVMQFIGTIGIGGPVTLHSSMSTVHDGRLYVLAAATQVAGSSFAGGLFAANVRSTPVAQALRFPELASAYPSDFKVDADSGAFDRWAMTGETMPEGGVRLWLPDQIESVSRKALVGIEDRRPPDAIIEPEQYVGRTLDLDESEGVTVSAADGAARGYGVRALLVAGAEGATRTGPLDPIGIAEQCNDPIWVLPGDLNLFGPCNRLGKPVTSPCLHGDREVILAAVGPDGPAVVDDSGARGAAEPVSIDSLTTADTEAPVSRCAGQDWDQLWGTALFGRAPAPEPQAPEGRVGGLAECVSPSRESDQTSGDVILRGYSAKVTCGEDEAAGHAYLRGGAVDGLNVAEAVASFRIYRDAGRGVVSRVESVVRGIELDGVLRISLVRGTAESWANGRSQPVPAQDREAAYDPNCDFERTAGTCFQRHMFGVWTPAYRCGPCGDEHALVEGLNRALNPHLAVRLREPDMVLRRGAENGFLAAIQKPEHERFADLVLNNDLLQTVLPTLEVIRFAAPNRPFSRMGARGRQIYQFAGVEVSSSYGIQCLLLYDEASNTCAAEAQVPGSITVSLADGDGSPLADGVFEVRKDVDADGVLGLVDSLVGEGACVTAEDGIGTCTFDELQPGSYLVSQTAAPPGFTKIDEPWVSEVASGEARTVAFTNVSNLSSVDVSATDEDGKPVEGAEFAVFPDPDGDGAIAADASPAATCTTGADGTCSMSVPVGSYVLVQTSAPGGLEGIEPVAFAFASGGQTAAVGVTNYPAEGGVPQPEPQPGPIYTDPVPFSPPVETVDEYQPREAAGPPRVSVPKRVGGTIINVVRTPGDALRLLTRDPQQAAAFTAAIILFALAVMAIRRRQTAAALMNQQ